LRALLFAVNFDILGSEYQSERTMKKVKRLTNKEKKAIGWIDKKNAPTKGNKKPKAIPRPNTEFNAHSVYNAPPKPFIVPKENMNPPFTSRKFL